MSERADDDVRGEREQQQRRAARQLKQQQQQQQAQFQRGEASTAMATVAERRSLPSLDIMLGQPWHSWADTVKLHGSDGAELEESFKECGKHREAMRLCRDDMPIFGQCPAQDDFYLVMCSHCSQVVKPQAFQAHYERRHSSSNKPQTSSAVPIPRNKGSLGGGGGVASGGSLARPSSANSSVSKFFKSAKEKLPFHYRLQQEESPITTGKADKFHVKMDFSAKLTNVPASSSSNTVSTSPMKPGLNFPSIPKAPPLAPSQMPNGKGHLSSLDKKQDNSSASSRKTLNKRQEREFNPDIHCGVMDLTARKPCTRSLTCKTHSISQRRAVLGRRQRFDTLLAEHKSRARDKELQFRLDTSHPAPPLRDPPPPPSRLTQDPHQASHGNGTADATKPLPLSKPKPHNSALPRLNSINSHSGVDPSTTHQDQAHYPHPAPVGTETSRLSSDEGENEERDEASEKLDCHYSGYHPRPAAYCTFGSRLLGRACFTFDRRWDQVRSALTSMMDKHVNSQMWKKIPLASENSATTPTASHRTSTNSHSSSMSSGFHGLSSPSPYDIKPVLSYGTTLNARSSPQASAAEQPAYSGTSRQVSASSPQMPSAHSSSLPSLGSSRPLKSKSGSKSFRAREPSSSPSNTIIKGSASITSGANSSLSTGKKRKNSSLTSHSAYTSESSSSFTLKKNCALNSSSLGSTYPTSVSSTPSSSSTLSSTSSSHSGVYSVGLNCTPGRANSLSLKQESSGRGPPSGSPAESIKRMSVVMNSSDSTLSLGPFVHQSSDHHTDARLEAKRRKGSPGSSSLNSTGLSLTSSGSGTGSGCVQGPGRPKITKSPSVNNIHSKHTRSISGPPGLPNNSLIYQPKARP